MNLSYSTNISTSRTAYLRLCIRTCWNNCIFFCRRLGLDKYSLSIHVEGELSLLRLFRVFYVKELTGLMGRGGIRIVFSLKGLIQVF